MADDLVDVQSTSTSSVEGDRSGSAVDLLGDDGNPLSQSSKLTILDPIDRSKLDTVSKEINQSVDAKKKKEHS